jgi:hypothetical protein|tara:strand:- start:273 stop:449 length:177 start_codon:yes stop_codon:yes gene_type:complete
VKIGNKVQMKPMWIYPVATGKIIKITREYIVVVWENINGEWHYTEEQAKKLEVIDETG